MRPIELVVSGTLLSGIAAVGYAALDLPGLAEATTTVTRRVDCRAVDTAIAAFVAEHETLPTRIRDLDQYLRGDLSGFRIVGAAAAGPGCPAGAAP